MTGMRQHESGSWHMADIQRALIHVRYFTRGGPERYSACDRSKDLVPLPPGSRRRSARPPADKLRGGRFVR